MSQFVFDTILERKNTASWKWDKLEAVFGTNDLLPMWIADMDFAAPPEVAKAVRERAAHPIYGYATFPPSFYQAITGWLMRRHGWQTSKEWISVTPGVVPAIHIAVQAFTNPGDEIIIQPPVYPPFFRSIRENQRQIIENPLKYENGRYEIDFADLERKINPSVKMLLLCSPHNPVGRVWQAEELRKLTELCIKNDILIVSDEIHSDLIFKGRKHIPLASLSPEIAERTITCIAPSKTFNLAGLYTSATLISNPDLKRRFDKVLEVAAIGEGNVFGIAACEAAYTYGDAWLEALLEYLAQNAKYLTDFIGERLPQIKICQPEATYLGWLDFRELGLAPAELRDFLIRKAKVALNDGAAFGSAGEGFARINFGCPRSLLQEGLERIERAVKQL